MAVCLIWLLKKKEISLFHKERKNAQTNTSKNDKNDENVSPTQGSAGKAKILRNQTRHLSFEAIDREKSPNQNDPAAPSVKKDKEKSLIDLNNKSMVSLGDPDYQHSLSPTSKVKLKAEIFIHLKSGSIDTSYTTGELLGEGQVSFHEDNLNFYDFRSLREG